jgi:hypothetical protein
VRAHAEAREGRVGRLAQLLVELVRERGVVDSFEFKELAGRGLDREIIRRAREVDGGIEYGKVLSTSTCWGRLLPRRWAGRYIVYLRGARGRRS